MESLRKCLKLDVMRKALNTLPKTLDDTYERILSNLDEEYEEYALKIFEWLCYSKRSMQITEMVEVLAIDTADDATFRPEQRLPDPRDILTICSTLISVTTVANEEDASAQTAQTEEVRLAHFSVKEFLVSDRLKKASMHRYHITQLSAHVSMAKTCLTYLLHFESPTILTAEFDHEFPFVRYAAEFWPWHYRQITDDGKRKTVDFLGYNLVESKNFCFINWLRIFNPDRPLIGPDLNLETDKVLSPLYYMSRLGVSGVLKRLLQTGAIVNAEGGRYGNALSVASYKGHKEVVQLLLENGANANAEGGRYGNALAAASWNGHVEVLELLLENGAKANTESETYRSALSAASWTGREEIVQLLLDNGANVNAKSGDYGDVLSEASFRGHEKVVRLLLEKGANIDAEGGTHFGSALSAASWGGHEEVVRLLLHEGADVNGQSGRALREASKNGQKTIMRILLKNKADLTLVLHDQNEALQGVSVDDHEAMIGLLLKELYVPVETAAGAKLNERERKWIQWLYKP